MACFMATTAMAQNKMVVKTPSGLSTFATTDLTNVAINGNTLTLQSLTDGTLTIADAENISFQKVATGAVNILESQGWQESAYATFALYQGATSYNVYVKGENYADYTKVDQQLVRNYGTYGRVDVVGLKAGNYTLKVVPVVDNSEVTSAASETPVLNVVNYDRQGFAHKKWTGGIGAYNNDGTLKQGAKVLYITKNTFNTVSLEMTTSEKGNKTVVTGLGQILKTKQKGYDHTPLAIRIIGEITTADAAATERLSDQGGLLIKANDTDIDMAVTIEGIGEDAVFNGFGLGIVSGSDIEVRNMAVMQQGSSYDNMEVKGAIHVWIHNNDYFYGQKGGGDHGKGDGSLDAKDGCSYATFSYNRIQRMIDKYKLNNRITIHPFTNNIQAYYSRAQVYILSSRWEGWGLVLVEAMSHGLPVVSSDLPVCQEIMGDFGMYFRNGDVEDLSRRMGVATMINWKEKSAEAMDIAKNFSTDSIIKQWKALIEE